MKSKIMNLKMLVLSLTIVSVQQSFAQSTITGHVLSGTLPSAPTQYLGSSNAADVLFRSSGVERMRVLSTGNVGIGITAPTATLNVASTGAVPFFIQRTAGQVNGLKMYFTSNPAAGISVGSGSTIFQNTGTVSDLVFMPTPTSYSMVMKSTGNIGIGTTAPLAKLNIENGALRLTGVVPGFGGPLILFGGSATVAGNGEWGIEYETANPGLEGLNFWRPFGATGGSGNHYLFAHNSGRIGVNTNNPTAQLTVNGNVLIGDPAVVNLPAGYKLYVESGILTEKVKVAVKNSASWADFVFDKNYKLKSLSEVESFIKANKHLPEIPSAAEVVAEGVDLGQMNVKLLQKVEELTLYLIEQNKKIEEVQAELKKLKN